MKISQGTKQAKYLQKPYTNDYNNYDIQDFPNFTIHGDHIIDEPQNKACNNYHN